MAEGVGNAPTSARADPVFGTGAASLYLPAFRKAMGDTWRVRRRLGARRSHVRVTYHSPCITSEWLPGLDSHPHRAA